MVGPRKSCGVPGDNFGGSLYHVPLHSPLPDSQNNLHAWKVWEENRTPRVSPRPPPPAPRPPRLSSSHARSSTNTYYVLQPNKMTAGER